MGIGQENRELFAANARCNIRFTDVASQNLPYVPQNLISGLVAMVIIDLFEMVQVKHND